MFVAAKHTFCHYGALMQHSSVHLVGQASAPADLRKVAAESLHALRNIFYNGISKSFLRGRLHISSLENRIGCMYVCIVTGLTCAKPPTQEMADAEKAIADESKEADLYARICSPGTE
jgi:hypothetical protein